jgi:hypothetical protein
VTTTDNAESALATVVHVSDDDHQVTINRGANHGVKLDQRYLVYALSRDEINDPETGESLGHLEIVRGTGVVIHVQEKMATLQSDRSDKAGSRRIVRKPSSAYRSLFAITGALTEEEEYQNLPPRQLAFESPQVGDKAKRVNK